MRVVHTCIRIRDVDRSIDFYGHLGTRALIIELVDENLPNTPGSAASASGHVTDVT
jgi:catechol 2,3-dioxygenase-like lactoylglutathione lyase family enzyme